MLRQTTAAVLFAGWVASGWMAAQDRTGRGGIRPGLGFPPAAGRACVAARREGCADRSHAARSARGGGRGTHVRHRRGLAAGAAGGPGADPRPRGGDRAAGQDGSCGCMARCVSRASAAPRRWPRTKRPRASASSISIRVCARCPRRRSNCSLGVEGAPGAFAVFEDVAFLPAPERANRAAPHDLPEPGRRTSRPWS